MSGARPKVAIAYGAPAYPPFPYAPSEANDSVQQTVARALAHLGLDAAAQGTPAWNPFRELIRPGDRVFIKPNAVTHEYRKGCGCPGELFSVITHPSVLRAVAHYAAKALDGRGEIVIGDNPCIDADFAEYLAQTGLAEFPKLLAAEHGVACRVLDLRPRVTKDLTYYGFRSRTSEQPGDPEGASILNLGRESYFYGMNPLLFRGVFTDRWETIRHHLGERQEYSISNTILRSNVFISVPKLKTHHKVGATLNVKGLVGINDNKNFLVHWRIGYPKVGGDEYPVPHATTDSLKLMVRHLVSDLLPEGLYLGLRDQMKNGVVDRWLRPTKKTSADHYRGAWEGNDTCWRMAADLYNVFVRDLSGWRQQHGQQPRFFTVVDGIVGGEGSGPFCPSARPAGVILAGDDLLATDIVAARLMDFRIEDLRYLSALMRQHGLATADIDVRGERVPPDFFDHRHRYLRFQPPSGWPTLSLAQPPRSSTTEAREGTHL